LRFSTLLFTILTAYTPPSVFDTQRFTFP
jgi:hypothetical protein